MRLLFMLTMTASLVCAAAVFAQSSAEEPAIGETPAAGNADDSTTALPLPQPGRIDRSQIPALVGDILRQVSAARGTAPRQSHQPHRRHTHHAPQDASAAAEAPDTEEVVQTSGTTDEEVVDVPPPAPAEDLSEPQTIRQRGAPPAPEGAGALPAPPVGRPYSFRDRLMAKRLARIAQMKQTAAESGDAERMQQAEYLEGMVLELHEQGLFNFAQKFLATMQEQRAGESNSDAPPAEIPETDLGAPSALPEAELGEPEPLPGTELGEPEPLPAPDAEPVPDSPPEAE